MDGERYALAGWLAIAGACMAGPMSVLGFLHDARPERLGFLLPLLWLLAALNTAFGIYAILRFRHLINTRYGFHDVDTLITLMIIGQVILVTVASVGRLFAAAGPPLVLPFVGALAVIGIPMGIMGIMFGIRLQRLDSDLHGLRRPYAFLVIAACIGFLTIILAFAGWILMAAADFILGLIMIREARGAAEPEFI